MPPQKLEPIPASCLPPELWRQLATALEYEGWQEAETLYAQVHAALSGAEGPLRARALMDHAAALRRLDRPAQALEREAEAEALLGCPIAREEAEKSSVDELRESEARKGGLKGLLGNLFKRNS